MGGVTTCSRDDLRMQVEKLKLRNTLMPHEHDFLDQLCVHGNEIEVQLAFEKLSDEDLFFESTTPRSMGGVSSPLSTDTGDDCWFITEEGESAETSSSEGGEIKDDRDAPPTSDHDESPEGITVPTDKKKEEKDAPNNKVDGSDDPAVIDKLKDVPKPAPATRRKSTGSAVRLLALEARKRNNEMHGRMWKAHETGLAVTQNASRNSLMQRRDSSSGGSTSTAARLQRASAIMSGGREGGAGDNDIFRTRNAVDARIKATAMLFSKSPGTGGGSLNGIGRPPRRYQRSQSLLSTPPPRMPGRVGFGSSGGSGSDSQRNVSDNTSRSTGSRKSVTFNIDPSHLNNRVGLPPMSRPKFRRAISDSFQYNAKKELEDDKAGTSDPSTPVVPRTPFGSEQRSESNASIPSLHHGHPIRSDSISSIPSIHHATAIRQDSISSIPSIHHGHPIRQDSIGSIPSIHHATAIRQDSIGSIPSIHHATAIRQDSISSIPSIHHARAIRSNSVVSGSSFPSLHHGHHVGTDIDMYSESTLGDGFGTNAQTLEDLAFQQDAKARWLSQYYATSEEVATAWLNGSNTSNNMVPLDVAIPMSSTSETEDSTNPSGTVTALTGDEDDPLSPSSVPKKRFQKPVLMRLASRSNDNGMGVEVTEMSERSQDEEYFLYPSESQLPEFRTMRSLGDMSIRSVSSHDAFDSSFRTGERHPEIFRNIKRSLSDEDMSNLFLGSSGKFFGCCILFGIQRLPVCHSFVNLLFLSFISSVTFGSPWWQEKCS